MATSPHDTPAAPPLHKIVMFGARDYSDEDAVERTIRDLVDAFGVTRLLIITGGARGADTMIAQLGRRCNVHVAEIDALWSTRARGAGPQRNEVMRRLQPERGVGFHPDIENSKGTADMKRRLEEDNIPVEIVK